MTYRTDSQILKSADVSLRSFATRGVLTRSRTRRCAQATLTSTASRSRKIPIYAALNPKGLRHASVLHALIELRSADLNVARGIFPVQATLRHNLPLNRCVSRNLNSLGFRHDARGAVQPSDILLSYGAVGPPAVSSASPFTTPLSAFRSFLPPFSTLFTRSQLSGMSGNWSYYFSILETERRSMGRLWLLCVGLLRLRVRPISHDARPSLRTRIMTAAA